MSLNYCSAKRLRCQIGSSEQPVAEVAAQDATATVEQPKVAQAATEQAEVNADKAEPAGKTETAGDTEAKAEATEKVEEAGVEAVATAAEKTD